MVSWVLPIFVLRCMASSAVADSARFGASALSGVLGVDSAKPGLTLRDLPACFSLDGLQGENRARSGHLLAGFLALDLTVLTRRDQLWDTGRPE